MIRQRLAFLVTLLVWPLAVFAASNPPIDPPCPNCFDLSPKSPPDADCKECSKWLKGAARGAPLTTANSPSSDTPSGGGGCASGNCGDGSGDAPLFPATIGIDADGNAGFKLPLGPPARPGGMSGGALFFQVKALTDTGLPFDALRYSLAPAKPVLLPGGNVIRTDLWNDRH